jgi:hypothetical protein
VNIFKKNNRDEGFYSGEEVDLTNEDHSESARVEEGKAEEPRREEPKSSETTSIVEVSTIIPPVYSETLINQSNQSHKSIQSTVTSSPPHTQSGNLGRSMEDELRLPTLEEMDLKILINTGLSVKFCGVFRISPMKLLNDPSSVLP